MVPMRIFKKFLIPSSFAYGAQGIGAGSEPVCDEEGKRLIKPSDLPIYGDECYVCDGKPCDDPCALEAQVGYLRKELWVWVDKYKGYRSKVIEVCATGKVHYEASPNPKRPLYLEADGTPNEPRSAGRDSEPSKIVDEPSSKKKGKKKKGEDKKVLTVGDVDTIAEETEEETSPCGEVCHCGSDVSVKLP